jgi:hypothetical protein
MWFFLKAQFYPLKRSTRNAAVGGCILLWGGSHCCRNDIEPMVQANPTVLAHLERHSHAQEGV